MMPSVTQRPCPLCNDDSAPQSVTSPIRAEWQTLDDLRPFWFGIENERRFFTYHRCGVCGLLYNRTFFGNQQLAELYSSMPPNMDLVPDQAIEATQRGYFDDAMASGLVTSDALCGDYLEIGPDVGHVVAEAAARGAFDRFWLFEPNRDVHAVLGKAARGRPAFVLEDMMDLSAVPDRTVGLAVMVHVLDHLLDPLEMLGAIRRKLRPGGAILIVTHNESSLLRRVLGGRWPAFCLQHPQLYNPKTIRQMLDWAGFGEVRVTRSTNHFPVRFLGRQAMGALGLRRLNLPLPNWTLGLRLGNMMTIAKGDS